MNVFKFGGASISSIERIGKVKEILKTCSGQKIVVVISAIGKTTNALEKVAESFFKGNKEEALALFEAIKLQHLQTAKELLSTEDPQTTTRLLDVFTEVEWLLHDNPVRGYDYYYDQIVCAGELLSTIILSASFKEAGIYNTWIDVRDLFKTDDTFRDAVISWEATSNKINSIVHPLLEQYPVVVTQGFIGSTEDNESSTLGREGSDYSAAVFANILDADSLTIWKDVEGVMNADPKLFPDATIIPHLNYEEVIEMAYYGAQVIHPKTIKPLQNKNIPLYVKCFLNKDLPGTVIRDQHLDALPPIIVIKQHQALLHLHTRDFSFASGKPVAELYELLSTVHVQANLLQTGAVHIDICIDNNADKIEKLALEAARLFDVQVEKNLMLITIRHYTEALLKQFTRGKIIRLKQQSPETVQIVLGD